MRKSMLQGLIATALICCLGFFVINRAISTDASDAEKEPEITEQIPLATATAAPPEKQSPASAPLPSVEPSPEATETPAPEPESGIPDADITSWQYVLVNKEHPLSEDYAPDLAEPEPGVFFDSRAAESLSDFIGGARDAGLTVYISSSYRSYATQKYLFDNKVAQVGDREAAARIVAYPGTSEHQLGLAADIVDKHYEYMNESLADTRLSIWLKEHCAEYGFILRYPKDKQEITGIMFEPWHFRYVGREAAAYITENGLCLEEFCALYA